MTSKGFFLNTRWKLYKDTLEVYGRTAFRQRWKRKVCVISNVINVVFGRQCRDL